MHQLEAFYRWEGIYNAAEDERSPFFGQAHDQYELSLYDHVLHPSWEFIGSETLYVKVLFTSYEEDFTIIEMMGEWNDTLHNDAMHLKRNLIDLQIAEGISRFILIGENILNFHGLEDDYYQEWFEECEEGWIVAMGFREYVHREWNKYGIDAWLSWGGNLELENWRSLSPAKILELVDNEMRRRLR